MIRGLIFDFDGLILDTEVPDYAAWQEVFVEHGTTLPLDTWTPLIGTHEGTFDVYAYLEEQIGRPVEREAIRERRRARVHALILAQTVLPGVEAYISEAKQRGIKVGVASSSSREWVEGHLERLGLHVHFDAFRTRDDVGRVKPDPALYLAALAALGITADEAIAFEDSRNGLIAAKAADIFTVAVPNLMTQDLDLTGADVRLASLTEMPLTNLLAIAESQQDMHSS